MLLELIVLSLVVIIVCYLINRLIKRTRWAAEIDKIPGPKCNYPLINNADLVWKKGVPLSESVWPALKALCFKYYDDGLCRYWNGPNPMVMIYSAANVEKLLSSNVHIEKADEYRFAMPLLKTGLVTSGGQKWRSRRRLLTPTFHFKILNDFMPIFNEHAKVLVEKLSDYGGEFHDIRSDMGLATLDVICETAMGFQMHAQTNSKHPNIRAFRGFCELSAERLWSPHLWPDVIWNLTSRGRKMSKYTETMEKHSRGIIEERWQLKKESEAKESDAEAESNGTGKRKRRLAFLDLLLEHYSRQEIDIAGVQEEVDTFMFAGHETTANTLTFCLLCIGWENEIQGKIHEELDGVFGDDIERGITIEDLREMKYLEATVKEVLRLYPPLPLVARALRNPLELEKYTVPAGCSVFLMIDVLARNPEIFPEPEKFDPDRFLTENAAGRHPYAYLPFSAGTRGCLGQRFALMEVKTVLADILRRFNIESEKPPQDIKRIADIMMKPIEPINVKFTSRNP